VFDALIDTAMRSTPSEARSWMSCPEGQVEFAKLAAALAMRRDLDRAARPFARLKEAGFFRTHPPRPQIGPAMCGAS
jgi:hypothetical protein